MIPDFKKCTEAATDLLYRQETIHTKIDVSKLNYDKPIVFDSIQEYCRLTGADLLKYTQNNGVLCDGCTVHDNESGYYIILHNNEITCAERNNWTNAHEVGHIYIGHTSDGDIEEIEAHHFAAQLLMPEYVMYKLRGEVGSFSPQHIKNLFNVSMEAATKRAKTMESKHYYCSTTKDKAIYEKMENSITNYLKARNSRKERTFINLEQIQIY